MLRTTFKFLLIFLASVIVGVAIFRSMPYWPLPPGHPLYKTFGLTKPHVIGFLPYWLLGQSADTYDMLTEIAYFGLTVSGDGHIQKLVNPEEQEPGWTALSTGKLRDREATSLLVHLANEETISLLISNPVQSANNLLADIQPIMKEYAFSDLNLDIESFRDASPSTQQAYTAFVEVVSQAIKTNNLGTITIEVPVSSFVRPFMTDPKSLAPLVDRMVIMAYDFHYSGSYRAGPVAPLGGVPEVREIDVRSILHEALRFVPRGKIILGIPLYGYRWETLTNVDGAAVIPDSYAVASNKKMVETLASCSACRKEYDEVSKSPFVVEPVGPLFRQTFYEDETSIEEKLTFARELKLGGVAFWALGYESETLLSQVPDYKYLFDLTQ